VISSAGWTVSVERWKFNYRFLMLGSEFEVYVSRLVPVREDCSWDV
jgi:hypothetical protein